MPSDFSFPGRTVTRVYTDSQAGIFLFILAERHNEHWSFRGRGLCRWSSEMLIRHFINSHVQMIQDLNDFCNLDESASFILSLFSGSNMDYRLLQNCPCPPTLHMYARIDREPRRLWKTRRAVQVQLRSGRPKRKMQGRKFGHRFPLSRHLWREGQSERGHDWSIPQTAPLSIQ